MQVNAQMARGMVEVLDELRKTIFEGRKPDYPYAEWERKREKVKERLMHLPEYVEAAAKPMVHKTHTLGRKKSINLVQRTMLFLFTRLMQKSNRDVENLLGLFKPLFGFKTSYKSVERLYSDDEVLAVIRNLFVLLLNDEGISGKFSGDGSGYALTVTRHYRTNPHKKCKDYVYVFRLIDIDTGMYVACGYSSKSEKDAFDKSMKLIKELGIAIDSVALDRYYSSRKVLKMFKKETTVYVIPKKNIAKLGPEWVRVVRRIVEAPITFLKKYFERNSSEWGFSSDKRRFGWTIKQKREDRKEAAMFSIALMHNLFAIRVKPG